MGTQTEPFALKKPMDVAEAKKKFNSQKSGAKQRGIKWELTFEQWLGFWGDDLDQRGSRHDRLQMQRPADSGPYAVGNIRKGYPMDNSRTYARVSATRRSEIAKAVTERLQDGMMAARSEPDEDLPHWKPEDVATSAAVKSKRSPFYTDQRNLGNRRRKTYIHG